VINKPPVIIAVGLDKHTQAGRRLLKNFPGCPKGDIWDVKLVYAVKEFSKV
jgi:hypothetical protein